MCVEEPFHVTAPGVRRLREESPCESLSSREKTGKRNCENSCCRFLHQPFQPSTHITLQHFPWEQEFNYSVPVPTQTTETSSGFINSTLFSLTEGAAHDQIKQRFNFAPITRDTDPRQGNRFHYSTSCTDVTLPCSSCIPDF